MKRITLLMTVACVALAATPLWACSVPVFRYALERWRADPYEVVVFHRGQLGEKEQAIVNNLTPDGLAGEMFANVRLHTLDLDDNPSEDQLTMWKAQKTETLPWMVVKYPLATRNPTDVWAGPLSHEIVKRLLVSPLRREVARLLLKGESAVWILLECGDKKKDDAAYQLLKKRLAYLKRSLKLPELEEQDIAEGLMEIDPDRLKLSYSLLRLSRDAPQENLLVEMLLGSEEDLRSPELVNQPMAFPIFGRGRVLYALVGAGINNETIDEACIFLVGPCSCQVKDLNPGTDLLTAVDWEALIDPEIEIDKALPPLIGLASFTEQRGANDVTPPEANTTPEAAPDPDQTADAEAAAVRSETPQPVPRSVEVDAMSPLLRNILVVVGIGVIGVAAASFLLIYRKG